MNPNRAWRCHYIIPLPFQWLNRWSEQRIQLMQQKKCDNHEQDGSTCTEGSHLSRLHGVFVFIAFSGFICLCTSLQLLYIDPGMKEFIVTYGRTKAIKWPSLSSAYFIGRCEHVPTGWRGGGSSSKANRRRAWMSRTRQSSPARTSQMTATPTRRRIYREQQESHLQAQVRPASEPPYVGTYPEAFRCHKWQIKSTIFIENSTISRADLDQIRLHRQLDSWTAGNALLGLHLMQFVCNLIIYLSD